MLPLELHLVELNHFDFEEESQGMYNCTYMALYLYVLIHFICGYDQLSVTLAYIFC
jgi:hypothetical protein